MKEIQRSTFKVFGQDCQALRHRLVAQLPHGWIGTGTAFPILNQEFHRIGPLTPMCKTQAFMSTWKASSAWCFSWAGFLKTTETAPSLPPVFPRMRAIRQYQVATASPHSLNLNLTAFANGQELPLSSRPTM